MIEQKQNSVRTKSEKSACFSPNPRVYIDVSDMGKLRMKETASERAAKETSSSSSRKEHRKKKRRKRGSTHDNDNDHDEEDEQGAAGVKPTKHYQKSDDGNDEDAYVPPRPSKDRPYVPYTFNDLDDESRLPSQNAHKRDRATEHEEFNQRLFDAMKDDEGLPDPYSNSASRSGMSFDYREALPDRRAFGTNGIANDRFVDPDTGIIVNRIIFKDAMTEEEYVFFDTGSLRSQSSFVLFLFVVLGSIGTLSMSEGECFGGRGKRKLRDLRSRSGRAGCARRKLRKK